jgi:hypothetical protein
MLQVVAPFREDRHVDPGERPDLLSRYPLVPELPARVGGEDGFQEIPFVELAGQVELVEFGPGGLDDPEGRRLSRGHIGGAASAAGPL